MYCAHNLCYHFLAKGGIANEKKTQRHYPVLCNVFCSYLDYRGKNAPVQEKTAGISPADQNNTSMIKHTFVLGFLPCEQFFRDVQ